MQEVVKNLLEVSASAIIPILIQQIPEIIVGVTVFAYSRDWVKLKKIVEEESYRLADSVLTNEEKLNTVIDAVMAVLPKKMKVFPASLFINKQTIQNLVNLVYVTRVKPKRDIEKTQVLSDETGETQKKERLRDNKGRFIKETE